jgi:hypothetical protein
LLEEDRLQAGQVGSVEDIFVGNIVLPLDAKNVAETTLVDMHGRIKIYLKYSLYFNPTLGKFILSPQKKRQKSVLTRIRTSDPSMLRPTLYQ